MLPVTLNTPAQSYHLGKFSSRRTGHLVVLVKGPRMTHTVVPFYWVLDECGVWDGVSFHGTFTGPHEAHHIILG